MPDVFVIDEGTTSWDPAARQTILDGCRSRGLVTEVGPVETLTVEEDGARVIVVLPGSSDHWLATVVELVRRFDAVDPVVVGGIRNGNLLRLALYLGVAGYCRAEQGPQAAVATIQAVQRMGAAIPRDMVSPVIDALRHNRAREISTDHGAASLTAREWDVLVHVWQRQTTAEIAEELYLSTGTVRSHISAIVGKLGVADREQAIAMFDRFIAQDANAVR